VEGHELKYLSQRLKISGGIAKRKRIVMNAKPKEYRTVT